MTARLLARLAAWFRARYQFHSWGWRYDYWDVGVRPWEDKNGPYRWVLQIGPFEIRRKKP